MSIWKGPKITKKFFFALKKKRLSKKIQLLPFFLNDNLKKRKVFLKLLGFKLGEFMLNRRKVWHKQK